MGEIISFQHVKTMKSQSIKGGERVKALARGEVQVYICDNCGEEFEVISDNYPDKCPGCKLRITSWKT